MTDSKVNNNSTWQNLDWEKKVSICNQSIANEDSLLLTLVIMFIALEAMLFTILITKGWGQLWSIVLAIFGVVLVILYMYLFKRRGNQVDLWGEKLYRLWEEAGQQDLAQHYIGCVERRCKRKEKCGWWKVTFGWCEKDKKKGRFKRTISWFKCFKSTRRLFTTFIPMGLLVVWIVLMVVSFYC